MSTEIVEITACLASLERMIERAKLLSEEFELRIRSVDYKGPPVSSLEHAISFPEVRSLDLLCKDAIERTLPDHAGLAQKWYVHKDVGMDGAEDLLRDLVAKRAILQHALDLIQAKIAVRPESTKATSYSLPKEYQKLVEPVRMFFEDEVRRCQDYDKNVFIMTRFQPGNDTLEALDKTIREKLSTHGLIGHRADDRCYPNDRNLWDNVCTYIFCCKYGIAVLENIIVDEFNPNVALEYGFMRALGKPTLLLKEQRFRPRADILGTLWNDFDILQVEKTVGSAIDRWLDDIGIGEP